MKKIILALVIFFAPAAVSGAALNINTASKEELTALKGVGDKRAQDIIDYRTKNGPFKSIDDLEKVPGIGPGFVKRIRSQITTGTKTASEKPAQNVIKSKATTASTQPAKSQGLTSNKASEKVAEKLTTGTKSEAKKTK
jgi:competence protein ComEA